MIFTTESEIRATSGKIFGLKYKIRPSDKCKIQSETKCSVIKLCQSITLLNQYLARVFRQIPKNFLKNLLFFIDFITIIPTRHKPLSSSLTKAVIFCAAIISFANQAFAIESLDNRQKIVSSRSRKFYETDRAKQALGINGHYGSDYNSRAYEIASRYLYQNNKFIHEINFQYNLGFADSGSGKNKKYGIKQKDEYDGIFSSKIRIRDTPYYGVLFHRTIYDRLSAAYYDVRNAVGLGKMFFDERLELDLGGGYHRVKTYGDEFEVVGSLRLNKRLTKRLNLIQRGFVFINHGSIDDKIMTSLTYRLENKLSLEIRHEFATRKYDEGNRIVTNRVSRSLNLGLVFDLN